MNGKDPWDIAHFLYTETESRQHSINMIKVDSFAEVCKTKEECYVKGEIATEYFINYGMRHNINGPAVLYNSGFKSYYIYGKYIGTNLTEEEFQSKIKELVFG